MLHNYQFYTMQKILNNDMVEEYKNNNKNKNIIKLRINQLQWKNKITQNMCQSHGLV